MAKLFEGTYCVERWWDDDSGIEQTLAACSNVHVARAAYAEAILRFPDKLIYLRNKSMVMERHAPGADDRLN